MHAATYHTQPGPEAKGNSDPLSTSVGHLLSKACSNTCFTAAQAFSQLVQPTARFQLALDALLPILDSPRSEVSVPLSSCHAINHQRMRFCANIVPIYLLIRSCGSKLPQRILVTYILYSLYAPHPIAINPFKSVLFDTFAKERNAAVQLAGEGKMSENEQLVWVLWKVLKGDGDHVSDSFSVVDNLSRSRVARAIPTKYIGTGVTPIQIKSGKLGPG